MRPTPYAASAAPNWNSLPPTMLPERKFCAIAALDTSLVTDRSNWCDAVAARVPMVNQVTDSSLPRLRKSVNVLPKRSWKTEGVDVAGMPLVLVDAGFGVCANAGCPPRQRVQTRSADVARLFTGPSI